MRLLLICVLAIASSPAFARTKAFQLSGGREAVIETEVSKNASTWIVFLPGSGCGLYDPSGGFFLNVLRAKKSFDLLVINKAGADESGNCHEKEFEFSATRDQRISDIREVMNSELPKDARVLLIGESEGGYISAEVALKDPRVVAMIWASGGTRSWIEEEISFVAPNRRAKLRKFMDEEVRPNPTLDRHYNGWTFAQLDSYDNDRGVTSLRSLSIPSLLLNGELDTNTWVEGTTEDVRGLIDREGKTNLEFHLFRGADHGLNCVKGAACDQNKLLQDMAALLDGFVERSSL